MVNKELIDYIRRNIRTTWSEDLNEIAEIIQYELADRHIPAGFREDCQCIGCATYREKRKAWTR